MYAQIEKENARYLLESGALSPVHIWRADHKQLESLMCKPLTKAPRSLRGTMMHFVKYDTKISISRVPTCSLPTYYRVHL